MRRPYKPLTIERIFQAGKVGRTTWTWGTADAASINAEIYTYGAAMRARSRYLWANNEYFLRALSLFRRNVIGPKGIRLQWRARARTGKRTLRRPLNAAIEARFAAWSRLGVCEASGRLDWIDLQRSFIEGLLREGEVLWIFEDAYPHNDNGLAVRQVETDRLDYHYNLDRYPGTGNQVIMSVEVDGYGRHVAYHVLDQVPQGAGAILGAASPVGERRRRIPADRCLFAFLPVRPDQVRGIPWGHAAMIGLHDTGAYREAAILAARMGAAKLGFWKSPDADGGARDYVDGEGQAYLTAEPGTFPRIGPDDELVEWDPTYPHELFSDFMKSMLRGVGMGLGLSYHSLAGDLEGVTFSSARVGTLDEQDGFIELQEWTARHLCEPVVRRWIERELTLGLISAGAGRPLTIDRLDDIYAPSWQGRRWPWVQPLQEEQAHAAAVGLSTKSISSVIRHRGEDPEEVFDELADDYAELRRRGIEPQVPNNLQPPATAGDTEGASDEGNEGSADDGAAESEQDPVSGGRDRARRVVRLGTKQGH